MSTPFFGIRCGRIQQTFSAILIGASLALSGCATTGEEKDAVVMSQADPYENINRKIFYFNDKVDDYVAEPVSNAYKWVTPQFVQTGIFNFFNNLKNINVVLNDMFQAKFEQGAQDSGRFLMNTTVGLAGLFDVAKHVGWEQNEEDFDQTLAVWGVPQGSYLVIPFLGPTTYRGIPGTVFDTAANPATYVGLPVQLVSMLNARANAEGALKFIDEAALDPYVFTRESYLQWRVSLATDGKSELSSDLSAFEDEIDAEDDNQNSGQKSADVDDAGISAAIPSQGSKEDTQTQAQAQATAGDTAHFTQVANSFGGVTQSFDDTAKSFEAAGDKLDQLIAQKKN